MTPPTIAPTFGPCLSLEEEAVSFPAVLTRPGPVTVWVWVWDWVLFPAVPLPAVVPLLGAVSFPAAVPLPPTASAPLRGPRHSPAPVAVPFNSACQSQSFAALAVSLTRSAPPRHAQPRAHAHSLCGQHELCAAKIELFLRVRIPHLDCVPLRGVEHFAPKPREPLYGPREVGLNLGIRFTKTRRWRRDAVSDKARVMSDLSPDAEKGCVRP